MTTPQLPTPLTPDARKSRSGNRHGELVRKQIIALLRAGTTYRRIAEITGVSKSRVGQINDQFRGLKPEIVKPARVIAAPRSREPSLCPTCERRVLKPCVKCAADAFSRQRKDGAT